MQVAEYEKSYNHEQQLKLRTIYPAKNTNCDLLLGKQKMFALNDSYQWNTFSNQSFEVQN